MNKYAYLRGGEKIRILHQDDKVVFGVIQIAYQYPFDGNRWIVELTPDQILNSPPIESLSSEVTQLQAKVNKLKEKIQETKTEMNKAESEYVGKMAKYARRSAALEKLDEFLDGEITHYFIPNRQSPKILTLEETISNTYSRAAGRFLSLSYRATGNVGWSLNRFADGSVSDSVCIPCTSYEEARQAAQQYINEQAEAKFYAESIIKFAEKHTLLLPDGYVQSLITNARVELFNTTRKRKANDDRLLREQEAKWAVLLSNTKDM